MTKYLQPSVYDSMNGSEDVGIPTPETGFQGTIAMTLTTAAQNTAAGNSPPALFDVPMTSWIPLESGNANVPMTYAEWAAYHGLSPGSALDDSDGDGRSNRAEYFFGGDPYTQQFGPPPVTFTCTGGTLQLSFPRSLVASETPFELRTSIDLLSWTLASYSSVTSTPLDAYSDQVTFLIPLSTEARRFYRAVVP